MTDPSRIHDPLAAIAQFHRVSSRHSWDQPETPFRPIAPARVPLPPATCPDAPVSECISGRVSCRRFDQSAPVSLSDLSTLLHLAYGHLGRVETLQHTLEARPVPSASGLYALQLLVIARSVDALPAAIYRYDPGGHALLTAAALPDGQTMMQVFLQQGWVAQAPITLVIAGRPAEVAERYHERAYRFLLLECGHVGQNLLLGTQALGLGCCPIGGFEDYRLCCAAGLNPEVEWPLYAAAIGAADPAFSDDLRTPEDYAGL